MKIIWILTLCFLFVGCSVTHLNEVTQDYYGGRPKRAYELSVKASGIELSNKTQEKQNDIQETLLYQITSGVIGFELGEALGVSYLEVAEWNMLLQERQWSLSKLSNVYQPYLYESALLNYYKGLAYLAEEKRAEARVEFNRASDRQRRIKEFYAKEIAKVGNPKQEMHAKLTGKVELQSLDDEIEKIMRINGGREELAGFINPMIDYVSGLFFLLEGDRGKAIDFLKEAYGVAKTTGEKEVLKSDLLLADSGLGEEKYTWVFIEDGRGPYKQSQKIAFPVIIPVGLEVVSVDLALPVFKEGMRFSDFYTLKTLQEEIKADRVASLMPLASKEFQIQYPYILTGEILKAVLKVVAQVSVQKAALRSGGEMAQFGAMLAGMLLSKALTPEADTRIVSVFPHSFYVARVKNRVGKLEVIARGGRIAEFVLGKSCENSDLCVQNHNLIYVRNTGKSVLTRVLMSKEQE